MKPILSFLHAFVSFAIDNLKDFVYTKFYFMIKTFPLLLLTVLLTGKCKKDNIDELSKLPSATQSGANTFGCLINGKAWVPFGYNSPYPNYRIILENTSGGLVLDIRVYRTFNGERTDLTLGGLINVGNASYDFRNKDTMTIQYSFGSCYMTPHDSLYRLGKLILSRLDFTSGIVSGTFECNLYRPDCGDTIRITNGRFDKKL
jgi:hypothetical protein